MSEVNINIDELLKKTENKFLLANAAAGRAKQIAEGSLPYVNNFDPNNPLVTALREIAADKIKIKVLTGAAKKQAELLKKAKEQEVLVPSMLDALAKGSKKKLEKKKKT